jgi:FkbM family methyltransferase
VNNTVRRSIKEVVPQRFHRIIKQIFRKQGGLNLKWTLKSGISISVASLADWVIYNDIFVDGEYDIPILECLHKWQSAKIINVLDLGANVGYFTLRFVDLTRRRGRHNFSYHVTMVEGSPTLANELSARVKSTDDVETNVSIVHGLIGKREGFGKILENEFHPMNTIIHESNNGVQVKYIDLNSLLEAGETIHLVKCDIEGAELQFIENYPDLLRNVESAVFELHPKVCDTNRCIDLLKALGFVHCELLRKTEDFMVAYFLR